MRAYKHIILLFVFVGSSTLLLAQDSKDFRLAKQYYNKKEYDKAIELFEDLYDKQPRNGNYYLYYYYCLIQLQDYDQGIKLCKRQVKRYPRSSQYKIDLGYAYHLNGERKDADKIFSEVLDDLPSEVNQIRTTARSFQSRREVDYAVRAYTKGRQLLNAPTEFSYELANLYNTASSKDKMISTYLELLTADASQQRNIQNLLQSRIEKEEFDILRTDLIGRIQKNPDKPQLAELLIWFFVQQKNFSGAFVQAKALDKRMNDNGKRIFRLATVAVENEDYDAALEMFDYLANTSDYSTLKMDARKEYLNTAYAKLKKDNVYEQEDLLKIESEYLKFIEDFGNGMLTVNLQRKLAELEGMDLDNLDKAIELLLHAKQLPGLDPRTQAAIKLDLGDFYLMNGDVWEPTLLYGQVDKDFRDEPIGQEAKFRNARLSFYRGEFSWAQAQFDVLKASTSQKIANDAIALSLLIQDNLGLDTITTTMEMFAEGHLLAFRNRSNEATAIFTRILEEYPFHNITDEVWIQMADINMKARDYEKAVEFYDKILKEFPDDILGDDALYKKAQIVEERFRDKEQAMLLYQKVLLDYPNSLYTTDARKRYRALRGDFEFAP